MAIPSYTQYVSDLSTMLVIPPTNADFLNAIPMIIDDAEQRIYRELDLLTTIIRNSAGTTTANNRLFQFPTHFVVSENINVFTPAGNTTGLTGRRALIPTSREWMDFVYPDDMACGCCGESVPEYYAMLTDQTILLGPPPDAVYTIEVIGTIRPTPLSAANPTTYLTQYLPDLFMAESLIFGFGYLQDFGSMSDNPQASVSWNSHYQDLWQSAMVEESRKKYGSQGWTPKQPSTVATPART